MSEDISSTIRVGTTVTLVAALIAIVLNLMVVSQSILGSGLSTLQSGVTQVTLQEFNKYDQKKITGIEVKSALTLYSGQDIAIVIRTNMCANNNAGGSWAWNYGALLDGATTTTNNNSTVARITTAPTKRQGDSYYTHNLQLNANGVIESNNNIKNINATGSSEFILETGKFQAELIKDETGTIVGMLFTQIP